MEISATLTNRTDAKFILKDFCDFCGCYVEPIEKKRSTIMQIVSGDKYEYMCPECGNMMA